MKKRYLKLSKWIEQEKFTKFLIAGLLVLIIITGSYLFLLPQLKVLASAFLGITSIQRENSVVESLSPIPTEIVIPSLIPTVYIYEPQPTIDPDPIEPCTSKNSGDSIKVKRSECQNNYVDCQINGTWKVLTKTKCSQDQLDYYKTGTHAYPTYTPLPTYAPYPTAPYPTSKPYPTSYQAPIPTIDQQAIDYLITACKNYCISSADYEYNIALNQCRANNTVGSSFCKLPSKDTLINNCKSKC